MKIEEKKRFYINYISTHFGRFHNDRQDFSNYYKYFKKNYLRHLPSDRNVKILDLGCGMGHFLYFLEMVGYKNILGLDISKENIEFCIKNKMHAELWDIFTFLEKTTGTYDVIVMNDIIEHLEKPEIMCLLNLIFEKLENNGRLIIKAPNASNPIMSTSGRYIDFTHELLFTEESISQILRISGFNYIKIYPQDLYIFSYNPLNYIAKGFNFFINGLFRLLFRFYGRKTTKIFTKNLIAIAIKE